MAVSIRTIVYAYIACKVLFLARGEHLLAAIAKMSGQGIVLLEMKNLYRKINSAKKETHYIITNRSKVTFKAMKHGSA
jgi:hypothetical protein